MRNLDHNALYGYYVLLIVYSYILARSILSQGILSTLFLLLCPRLSLLRLAQLPLNK
jgi:hypothetical protein